MPVPINRNTDTSYGILGAIKNFISPPGYVSRGPLGSSPRGSQPASTANRPVGTQAVLGGKPVYWGGDNYGWQQLNQTGTSATLNALNSPGALAAFTGAGSNPAERAYQTEKDRVAQLTAQDPELQRYEAARKAAVAPGATPEQVQSAEDIGMQIWAKANPKLAAKVKPGQSGYEAIQGVLNAGAMGAPMNLPFDTSKLLGGTPAPQGLSYAGTTPASIPGGTPIKSGGFPTGQAAMFERFLQGQGPSAAGLTASPLGVAQPIGALNYGGAVQPLGTALADDFYKSEKAQELAKMFANSRFAQ